MQRLIKPGTSRKARYANWKTQQIRNANEGYKLFTEDTAVYKRLAP